MDRNEERKRLIVAYQAVFGQSELDSNEYAALVYKDLSEACFKEKGTTAKANGAICPLGTLFNNGKRFVISRIDEFRKLDPNEERQKEA